ncbi:MAG: ATP-dependent RecD-like DNA helicase [Verrucomicrobiota bacterium]|nr:ATP-dependent RecD-like DNA helicase [Verrucomicrobiota bacterium]
MSLSANRDEVEKISLCGTVESIVYIQPENGFTVAKLRLRPSKTTVTIVGYLPDLHAGELVSCEGEWKCHPSHGKQFSVTDYRVEMPTDVIGIQRYLESGFIKGIGTGFAKKIVEHFGEKTLQVIEETPERLEEIRGLGSKKIESLKASLEAERKVRDVMLFLRTHGVSPGFAQKIHKVYGDAAIERVRSNPYDLAKDIFGIGFRLADQIAQKLGFALHSPERLRAGIQHLFWELSEEGHTCYPEKELLPAAQKMLETDSELTKGNIEDLVQKNIIVRKNEFLWLGPFYGYEQGIARDFRRLQTNLQAIRSIDTPKAVEWVEKMASISFAPGQKDAIIAALTHKVHIITGGPGTGKSTITRSILAITEKLTDKILLAAPTGRAAKRLSQITHRKAFTIHALLEMDFVAGGFKRGRDDPLKCDLLIIDEASMIDTPLLFHLLKAIPSHARLLLVGDIDQLPSVGPGTVLKDLIASETVPVTRLTEIFRQAKGSLIVTNAHRINNGEFPFINTPAEADFHFIAAETPEAIHQILLELVTKEVPKRWGFRSLEEIQVLSPMKKGMIGVEWLNQSLQQALNPSHQPIFKFGSRFHVGDKVMQIKNHYQKEVYNGDIGKIHSIDRIQQTLAVTFDDRLIPYQFTELDQLVLAYATSVHKFQGSECPCIIIPLHTSHARLLQRNLLYTAVTRGKRQVFIVGTTKAVAIAVHNDEVQRRYTGLKTALKQEIIV